MKNKYIFNIKKARHTAFVPPKSLALLGKHPKATGGTEMKKPTMEQWVSWAEGIEVEEGNSDADNNGER